MSPTLTWLRAARYPALAGLAIVGATPVAAQRGATVAGRIVVMDRGDKSARDVGQAVVWLEGVGARAAAPGSATVITEDKEFRPRVTVVQVGSTVSFPNNDPFNHNVFSLSQEGPFDLGLYARGEASAARFDRVGVIRVYCNVHPQMAAFVVVRDNAHYTRPSADGSFRLDGVTPGKYVLRAWHERAGDAAREIQVPPQGIALEAFELDARGFKVVQHLNKFGQPYSNRGVRY